MDRDVNVRGGMAGSGSLNVNIAAQSGSHINAPVLTNNHIIGNVQIINNAPGVTGHRSARTQASDRINSLLRYKKHIRIEYKYVTEYNSLPGEHVQLCDRFVQPLIIPMHRDQKEREEEISSRGEAFQNLGSRNAQNTVSLNSLFSSDRSEINPAVILQGNSGNGKSFAVQKLMLDWASDLCRTNFDVIFHLKCKEISHMSSDANLVELLSHTCFLTSDEISALLQQSPERVLFLVDGFDELKYSEDIFDHSPPRDPSRRAAPVVTLCALLKGQILRESCLLVTTRSTAIDNLKNVLKEPQRFTEIIGFSEKGVEEYFQKFFQNDALFRKGYEYVSANETLLTACSIPVICWIICTVIRERLNDEAEDSSGLETTTSIYVDFLCTLLEHHSRGSTQSVHSLVRSLGRLAEKGILAQQVLFDEKTVYETVSNLDSSPFLCKFLFKKRIHQETMFSFMHVSFQEFFTALYYLLLDEQESKTKLTQIFSTDDFSSKSGNHYDAPRFAAIVHFIFGLLNKDVRSTLSRRHGLLVCSNIKDHLKKWIFKQMHYSFSQRTMFFFHCLYELHEADFVKEVVEAWPSVYIYNTFLRKTDCWALLYCCQCCQSIEELFVGFCPLTSEKLAIIRPALHKFRSIRFPDIELSESDLGGMMQVYSRKQTLSSQSVAFLSLRNPHINSFTLDISREWSSIYLSQNEDPRSFRLSVLRSDMARIDWMRLFQTRGTDALLFILRSSSARELEMKLETVTKVWAKMILSFTRDYTSLTEIRTEADWFPEEAERFLKTSQPRPGCSLSFQGFRCSKSAGVCRDNQINPSCNNLVKISLDKKGFSAEGLRRPLFWD